MHGKHLASFKPRAFRNDAPSHFRESAVCKYSFKAILAKLFSCWSVALGAAAHLHVVLDGARFPLKAAEHARRSDGQTYESRLAAAVAADTAGNATEAEKLYKELAMVACPPEVDAWIIAHCRKYGYTLHVAPVEADSMCGRLAFDGDVDAVLSYDPRVRRAVCRGRLCGVREGAPFA